MDVFVVEYAVTNQAQDGDKMKQHSGQSHNENKRNDVFSTELRRQSEEQNEEIYRQKIPVSSNFVVVEV